LNFLGGVANAYGSDNLLGAGRVEQTTTAGRIGAAVGDFGATVTGGLEVLGGGGEALVTAPAGVTGVGIVVPAVGVAVAAHGVSAAGEGFSNLFKSAMAPKEGESGGPGAGKSIADKTKGEALQENKTASGGEAKCVFCGEKVGEGTGNKINYDHAQAKANGGNNTLNNTNVACEYCNKSKGTSNAPKNPKKPDGN
jgi:HNH endonuclease